MTKGELIIVFTLWIIGTYHYVFVGEHVVGMLWYLTMMLELILVRLGDNKK